MSQWYVKELSKLTHISVQTLHHYDRIDLLKPSVRLSNGYRLYSEKDLLKLQQIIALKFFGFELAKIKVLLSKEVDLIEHLTAQSQLLQEQAKSLLMASQDLNGIIAECSRDKSIRWETIIKSIEVYRMIQQFEKSWEGKVFDTEELKKYARFEQDKKQRFTESELKKISAQWKDILAEVNTNLDKDPESEFGIALGKRAMDWVNHYYGKENITLRNKIWEKGFKEGKVESDYSLSAECITWLDRAISAHYRARIIHILNQVGTRPDNLVLKEWEELMFDMCGDEKAARNEIFQAVLAHHDIKQTAKDWVRSYMEK